MPKTYINLWTKIISWENIYNAYLEARKGKRYRDEVLKFTNNLEENLINIQNHLYWKTWRPGKWREFIVYEPKARFIQAPQFKDRVVHHALVRNIEPLYEKKFIYDSHACRVGKGTHLAVLRTQKYLKKAYSKWGKIYVLKADIKKYFPSVRHDILTGILKRTIRDKNVLWLCKTIIKKCGNGKRGIPVGALTSQLFANIYLDQLDHFIKDDLGIKYYVRYMDDWVIIEQNKKRLWDILEQAACFLSNKLELALNPKTKIFPVKQGVDFCGYRIWTTHILPRKRNTKRARRRFRKLAKLYSEDKISLIKINQCVMSFLGYMKHCSGYRTTQSVLDELVLKR